MTIRELYDRLDWSQVDNLYDEWAEATGRAPPIYDEYGEEETEEHVHGFEYRFRCVLLEQALMQPTEKIRDEARAWLTAAGVWSQVVEIVRSDPAFALQS